MAALENKIVTSEKKEESKCKFTITSDGFLFTPAEYGDKIWRFRSVKDKKRYVVFIIGEETQGKVTKITLLEKSNKIVVTTENGGEATTVLSSNKDYTDIAKELNKHCRQLIEKKGAKLMARMLAAVNGRNNFEFYSSLMSKLCPETCQEISRDMLLNMLKRESVIRLSKEMLDQVEQESREIEDEEIDSTDVCSSSSCGRRKRMNANDVHIPLTIITCQEMVAKEFGYQTKEEISYALQQLRSARSLYPNDMEIKNAAFYLKYNRACHGSFQVGDVWKDVKLMTCNEQETRLSQILNASSESKRPCLVMSGSIT